MIGAPGFDSWDEMQNSNWLKIVKQQMNSNQWPLECQRCQRTETLSDPHSIRLNSIQRHKLLSMYKKNYLILGGVLDNICNSACQSCNANLSTKIGSLENKNYIKTSNANLFNQVPMDQVVEIDLNGGEPTASPEYQKLLEDLPAQVKILRVNTNGSRLLPNIENILKKQIQLIVTLSLDGVDKVHDYVRWPIKWSKYTQTVQEYIELQKKYKNLKLEAWTTVHALNVGDFDNIVEFAKQNNLNHGWAFLVTPKELNPIYTNDFTSSAKKRLLTTEVSSQIATESNNTSMLERFIYVQDKLRNISIKDYL